MVKTLLASSLRSLPLLGRGKVRENYALGDDKILMVTSDRLSAFDVIMNEPIPDKGRVLTAMARFWFDQLSHIVPHHLTDITPESVAAPEEIAQVRGRAMVVKRLRPLPIEAVVRGYLAGSGWKEYQESGTVCGIRLPAGLQQASKLAQPIFTPATKADMGAHDENISFERMTEIIGATLAEQVRDVSLKLYQTASDYAATRGILIADTKFEFGLDKDGTLTLMDEVLTADSSRFWPTDSYREGINPPSFDKQFVRDYLESVPGWNKTAPAPALPAEVIAQTSNKYREALRQLTGAEVVQIGIVMGSASDWNVMQHAAHILDQFGVSFEAQVVSAHRMPDDMFKYAEQSSQRGLHAIIAGAGGAAHLPGMLAAKTAVPVLGVPVPSKYLLGTDSLHSIVQMPKGVPVATFAIGEAGAANAALFAVAMLAHHDKKLSQKLELFRAEQSAAARAMTLPC